jgi:hypothetical protein
MKAIRNDYTLHWNYVYFNRFLKVTRDSGKADASPSLKVSQRTMALSNLGGSETGFYRLSMSVQTAAVLASPAGGALPGTTSPVSPSKYSTIHIVSYWLKFPCHATLWMLIYRC